MHFAISVFFWKTAESYFLMQGSFYFNYYNVTVQLLNRINQKRPLIFIIRCIQTSDKFSFVSH